MVFPKVPIMAVLARMSLNILEYVRKTQNLKTLICLYQRSLDRPNIIYIVTPIISSDFKDLNFLILPKIGSISNIDKTMIFVNSVDKGRTLTIYLQSFLLNKLKDRGEDIIKSFSSILKTTTKTN